MSCAEFIKAGRPVIVFDLDDTLVDTSHVYWVARSSFVNIMVAHGIDATQVLQKFEELDGQNMMSMGFAPGRYGKSMRDTYQWFIGNSDLVPSAQLEKLIDDAGGLIFVQLPELIDGAKELLEWCSTRFDLVLLTRGLLNLQLKKIEHCNLGQYFRSIKVVSEKGASEFEEIITDAGHTLNDAWVIGDSIKSDINPGLDLGLKCILFVYAHHSYYWQQEYGHIPKGYFYSISRLVDAVNILQHPDMVKKVSALPS
jgi:putative hydrolase of the HAD superfamily